MSADAVMIKTHILDRAGRRKVKQELDKVVEDLSRVNNRMQDFLFNTEDWEWINYDHIYNQCLQEWAHLCEWYSRRLQHVIIDPFWFVNQYKPQL